MAQPRPNSAEEASDAASYWRTTLTEATRFMQMVAGHPVEECHEALTSIPAAADRESVLVICQTTPHPAGRSRDHRIRRSNIEPLLGAAQDLHGQGLTLVIEDAYRTVESQRACASSAAVINTFAEMLNRAVPAVSDRQIETWLAAIVAATPKTAGHLAGAAIDVSVRRADGTELDLGGPYLDTSERMPMTSPFISAEQASARDLLSTVMARHGFTAYPYEFWHYSCGDALAAAADESPVPARYGPVNVSQDGSVTPIRYVMRAFNDSATLVNAVRAAMRSLNP